MSFTDHESGLSMGGQFVSTKYRKGGQEFWITVRYIDYHGACLHYDQRVLIIEEFENVRPISLLDVGPLSGGDAKESSKVVVENSSVFKGNISWSIAVTYSKKFTGESFCI